MSDRIGYFLMSAAMIMIAVALTNSLTHRAVDGWWQTHDRDLRIHADYLANLNVVDETQVKVGYQSATCPEGHLCIEIQNTGVWSDVWSAPFPKLAIREWMQDPFTREMRASQTQWTCPPHYNLKFDGVIPYCDAEPGK